MVDLVKKFQEGDPPGIAADEEILAVTMVQPRGSIVGADSNAAFGGLVENIAGDVIRGGMADRARAAEGDIVGDLADGQVVRVRRDQPQGGRV